MKMKTLGLLIGLSLVMCISAFAKTASREILAEQAVSADEKESSEAIAGLRALGKTGLDALFTKYGAEIKQFSETGETNEKWKRIAFAIDSVAQQKDAYASKLFWHTNLEEAKKEAAKAGKPILTLRLLGNLNEEFSCANSRLFRSILYPNAEISKFLNENYILHWKSVRPAPKVTIDFGDGRKIERTLTGNSIHYTLGADGNIIDALPGLYSPQAFLKFLSESKKAEENGRKYFANQRVNQFAAYRKSVFENIKAQRNEHLAKSKITLSEPAKPASSVPVAIEAAPRAMSKMAVVSEIDILNSISDDFSKYQPQLKLDDWKKLALLYAADTKIDERGKSFIRRQTKNTVNDYSFSALLDNLNVFVALDSTRNDFLFRTEIYEIISNSSRINLETINDQVYAEVFLTPKSDEWLGLFSPTLYTALDGNGIIR